MSATTGQTTNNPAETTNNPAESINHPAESSNNPAASSNNPAETTPPPEGDTSTPKQTTTTTTPESSPTLAPGVITIVEGWTYWSTSNFVSTVASLSTVDGGSAQISWRSSNRIQSETWPAATPGATTGATTTTSSGVTTGTAAGSPGAGYTGNGAGFDGIYLKPVSCDIRMCVLCS
jgi:hypothetical protein